MIRQSTCCCHGVDEVVGVIQLVGTDHRIVGGWKRICNLKYFEDTS